MERGSRSCASNSLLMSLSDFPFFFPPSCHFPASQRVNSMVISSSFSGSVLSPFSPHNGPPPSLSVKEDRVSSPPLRDFFPGCFPPPAFYLISPDFSRPSSKSNTLSQNTPRRHLSFASLFLVEHAHPLRLPSCDQRAIRFGFLSIQARPPLPPQTFFPFLRLPVFFGLLLDLAAWAGLHFACHFLERAPSPLSSPPFAPPPWWSRIPHDGLFPPPPAVSSDTRPDLSFRHPMGPIAVKRLPGTFPVTDAPGLSLVPTSGPPHHNDATHAIRCRPSLTSLSLDPPPHFFWGFSAPSLVFPCNSVPRWTSGNSILCHEFFSLVFSVFFCSPAPPESRALSRGGKSPWRLLRSPPPGNTPFPEPPFFSPETFPLNIFPWRTSVDSWTMVFPMGSYSPVYPFSGMQKRFNHHPSHSSFPPVFSEAWSPFLYFRRAWLSHGSFLEMETLSCKAPFLFF